MSASAPTPIFGMPVFAVNAGAAAMLAVGMKTVGLGFVYSLASHPGLCPRACLGDMVSASSVLLEV